MKKARASRRQYTIRSVPVDVDRSLREQARRRNQSLNDVVLEALRRAAGVDGAERTYHDLDHLFGTLEPDPELDRILEEQRQIDPELWR